MEKKERNVNNNFKSILLCAMFLIILFLICLFFMYKKGYLNFNISDNKSVDEITSDNDESKVIIDNNVIGNDIDNGKITENTEIVAPGFARYLVKLEKKDKEVIVDGLEINVKVNNNAYNISAVYDGKEIDTSFFDDKIAFEDESLVVYKSSNVYMFLYSRPAQCYCTDIFVFDTDGEILYEFSDVEYTIELTKASPTISIKTSESKDCMFNTDSVETVYWFTEKMKPLAP